MGSKKNNADYAGGFVPDPERPDLTGAEVHPLYTILAGGVGSHVKGDVIMAGDLGTGADIARLLELGAIAPYQSAEGAQAQADAVQEAKDAGIVPADRVQQGVPYIDPASNTGEALATPPAGGQPEPVIDPQTTQTTY